MYLKCFVSGEKMLASVIGDVKLHLSAGLFRFRSRLLGITGQVVVFHFGGDPDFVVKLLNIPRVRVCCQPVFRHQAVFL
jgi:hypothetical protein